MSALDMLNNNNGLKTTQGVLQKQLSGVDAAQKANSEQMNMNTAQAMLHGKENLLTPPKDAHENAVRMNQQTADSMLHGYNPIVKKEEPKPQPVQQKPKKGMSYAEMFQLINPQETAEEKARREKRERSKAKIAAVADGIRALSNIYFASQGAQVAHDPGQDMTAAVNKRRQLIDAQRDKNKAAWLSGYQRALALDEEKSKNEQAIAEQKRYHDLIADNNKDKSDQANRRLDQKDVQLEQSQQRLDLSKLRYNTDAEYKNSILQLKKLDLDSKISHRQALDAAATLRARKHGRSSATKEDYDEAYMDLVGSDKSGVTAAEEEVARAGIKPNTAAGRKATVKNYRKNHAAKPKAPKPQSAPASNGNKAKAKEIAKKYNF